MKKELNKFSIEHYYRERLAVYSDIQDQMEYLHDTVLRYPKPTVIELGVRYGNSTAAFLYACEKVGGRLWSCDLDRMQVPSEFRDGPWEFMFGDSVSPEVLSWMPKECDILFVDTSHEVKQTLKEMNAYIPRVRKGGVALFHDTQWMPPDISLPDVGGPVTEALNRWCRTHGKTWTNRMSVGYYGLGVMQL